MLPLPQVRPELFLRCGGGGWLELPLQLRQDSTGVLPEAGARIVREDLEHHRRHFRELVETHVLVFLGAVHEVLPAEPGENEREQPSGFVRIHYVIVHVVVLVPPLRQALDGARPVAAAVLGHVEVRAVSPPLWAPGPLTYCPLKVSQAGPTRPHGDDVVLRLDPFPRGHAVARPGAPPLVLCRRSITAQPMQMT
eukprot:1865691-Pyramimonas_sp.AAC.1